MNPIRQNNNNNYNNMEKESITETVQRIFLKFEDFNEVVKARSANSTPMLASFPYVDIAPILSAPINNNNANTPNNNNTGNGFVHYQHSLRTQQQHFYTNQSQFNQFYYSQINNNNGYINNGYLHNNYNNNNNTNYYNNFYNNNNCNVPNNYYYNNPVNEHMPSNQQYGPNSNINNNNNYYYYNNNNNNSFNTISGPMQNIGANSLSSSPSITENELNVQQNTNIPNTPVVVANTNAPSSLFYNQSNQKYVCSYSGEW